MEKGRYGGPLAVCTPGNGKIPILMSAFLETHLGPEKCLPHFNHSVPQFPFLPIFLTVPG